MKQYNIREKIGKAKYVVSFHDGEKTHKDKSPFFDIKIFKTKKRLNIFLKDLDKQGYKPVF